MNAMKSKTIWFSLAVVATGLIEQYQGAVLDAVVPADFRGLALAGVGVIIAALRYATTKAVADK
jgi:hypothetical protein